MTIEQERLEQLERCVPDIWEHWTYLYVGANANRFHFKDKLAKKYLDVVEIDRGRAEYLDKRKEYSFIDMVYHSDISAFAKDNDSKYEVILWSHGPACISTMAILDDTLANLKSLCGLLVTLCPWGRYDNAPETLLYDRNVLALYPSFFTDRGFEVSVLGEPNTRTSNLLAYWRKK